MARIGTGNLTYGEIKLSATAMRNASADANRLVREWKNYRDCESVEDAEHWLIEGARECADNRYSFDTDAAMDRHWRYREEIERLFVDRVGGWDAIAASVSK